MTKNSTLKAKYATKSMKVGQHKHFLTYTTSSIGQERLGWEDSYDTANSVILFS
jgi:hypothetical protein